MTTHEHQIEHAATGSTVEQADARGHAGDAALRFAPPWVRERIAAIREERGLDREVENRAVVEHASEDRATAAVARSLQYAPPRIRARVNEARRRRGLPEIATPRPEPTGPGVWIADRATGTIRPVTSGSPRSPARPAASRGSAVVERVILLPAPSFADAPARSIARALLPETISPTAFGTAAELNADRSLDLRLGHHGPRLALVGGGMRFHDTPHGIAVEWIFDPRMPMAREAREAIRRGAVSVAMKIAESRTIRLPRPTTLVTRARLLHVAILGDDDYAAYPAAVAKMFPGSRAGDAAQVREQIAAVIAESKLRNERSRW
jgi:hypothetical protein